MTKTTTRYEVDVVDRPAIARERTNRILRNAGWTSIYLGAFILGFVVHQLFITTYFAQQAQSELAIERVEQWEETEIKQVFVVPNPDNPNEPIIVEGATGTDGDGVRSEPLVLQVESAPEEGTAFALIRIPKLERLREGWNVVEGVGTTDLRNGAGHMPETALPGQPGNAVISGHRTTYGMPFHELDALDPGDRIEVETALGMHVYEVRSFNVVGPKEFWVAEPREGAWLTLTTCHPKFSARQRFVVFAELVAGPNAEVIEVMS